MNQAVNGSIKRHSKEPQKPYRDTLFEGGPMDWIYERNGRKFLEAELASLPSRADSWLKFAWYFVLVCIYEGISLKVALSILVQLNWRELKRASTAANKHGVITIRTKPHYLELRDYHHTMILPIKYLPFLKRWLRKREEDKTRRLGDYVICETLAGLPSEELMLSRFRAIKKALEREHKRILNQCRDRQGYARLTLHRLSVTRYNALLSTGGLPAGLRKPLRDLPLPVDPSEESVDLIGALIAPKKPTARRPQTPPSYQVLADLAKEIKHSETAVLFERFPERIELSEHLIRITAEMKLIGREITTLGDKRLTKASREKVLLLADNLLQNPILEEGSVACVGVCWILKCLYMRAINPNTAKDYLRDTITRLAIHQGNGLPLTEWDQESVDELFEAITDGQSLKKSTILDKCRRLRSFFRYSKELGYLADVHLPYFRDEYLATTYRNHLLDPQDVEYTLTQLGEACSTECDIAWLLGTLGFYGMLRTSESLTLSLNDISIVYAINAPKSAKPAEVWIEVRAGKTPSAPRKIPLHALAPSRIIELLAAYVKERKQQFEAGTNWATVALIGTPNNPNPLEQTSATKIALTILRHYWGEQVDLHTLRHNGASWLMLRWYELHNTKLAESYAINFPSIFNKVLREKLLEHFTWGRLTTFSEQNHHLIEIANVMGHSSIASIFRSYIHCLSVINYAFLCDC